MLLGGAFSISSAMGIQGRDIPNLWNELDSAQQTQILSQNLVRVVGANPNLWEAKFYFWVNGAGAKGSPRDCAAIFWDLPGQASYQPNLKSFEILAGSGTAAVKALATVDLSMVGGPADYQYPQENTVFREGHGQGALFSSSWQTTDPSRPISPAFPQFSGEVSFQHFPGDQGGALMKYHVRIFPVAPLLGDLNQREQAFQMIEGLIRVHQGRMAQGASPQQISELERALH